ncbi:phosphoribosyl-ATP diphosphatase [Inquilinus sp. CAU 1745]|uniref:phosphoribosyl-ATP diphosphatase n=1 Tax=Inquilinus sp. CAU 1745 TaxID=3140369 RepID=UPI00325BE3C1
MTTSPDSAVLDRLYALIASRKGGDPEKSHTARLFARGRPKIAQKVGEEAVEAVIEAMRDDPRALASESADLLYHLLVLWADAGVRPSDVWAELARREGTSGVDEKKSRQPTDNRAGK